MSVTVHTQAELDAALERGEPTIYIESPAGVWLALTKTGSSHVEAWGSSHVEAWGSSHVVAGGSSHVEAWGSSRVEAWGSSRVEARESSRVVARGSSRVEARESSHVVARESSHVVARESSHVEAWGSSHVVARESSHVQAWGSSHVEARESSRVEAAPYVAVHLHSQRVTLSGGVVIDMTAVDHYDARQWCDLHGVKVTRGRARLFKAVDDDLCAGHAYLKTEYPIGKTVKCPDWEASNDCGNGLHVSPHVSQAFDHYRQATRFLEVSVRVSDIHPIDESKAKVPALKVEREVDRWGVPL